MSGIKTQSMPLQPGLTFSPARNSRCRLQWTQTDGSMTKTVTPNDADISTVDITYSFDYTYDGFPDEMILYFTPTIIKKFPFVSIAWLTPDGRKIRIADMAVQYKSTFRFSQDQKLQTRLNTENVMQALFADPKAETSNPVERDSINW